MKTVKVVWRWDDGDEVFVEWWTAKKDIAVEESKSSFLSSFVKGVRSRIVIVDIEFIAKD